MPFSTRITLAAVALAACVSEPAAAQTYVSVFGGGNFASDADNSGSGIVLTSKYDNGYVFGGAFGFTVAPNWRLEGEIAYRKNDLDKLTITNDGGIGVAAGVGSLNGLSIPATGDTSALSFMANAFYDFQGFSGIVPYIGGGVGIAKVSANHIRSLGALIVNDDDTMFAYQIGVGASMNIAPTAAVFLEYRFFGTADPSFHDSLGASFDSEYQSHAIMVGVRFGL